MSKIKLSLVAICLSDFEDVLPSSGQATQAIGLIQEALIDLGYNVQHVHQVQGDPTTLYPVRAYIKNVIVGQSNGIPTDSNVTIRIANAQCYSVLFFK
ncbi:hypothetical protein [Vibrio phage phiKT1028]|nr:hypothetical protein [Vibrio phage phiKT1028]